MMTRTIPDRRWRVFMALLAVITLSVMFAACETGPGAYGRKHRLARAQAIFAQRCQTAGEKIYRTVKNVDGIFLLKLRPDRINHGDQFALTDPYGEDLIGTAILSHSFAITMRQPIGFLLV